MTRTADFSGKPTCLEDIECGGDVESYTVEATVELTWAQYDAFRRHPMMPAPYDVQTYRGGRDGKGGVKVVRVVCKGKNKLPALLCNAEGYSYARYIAVEKNN